MKKTILFSFVIVAFLFAGACSTYKPKPLPFKAPSAYPNARKVAGAVVAAKAYDNPIEAREAFGFDILAAGLMPVQVVFDNQGPHHIMVNPRQTFLEDAQGNLWPILEKKLAYDRASKYAETKHIFKQGAYSGFLAGTAGAVIGAAIGVVTGDNVLSSAGKGAAVGAAAGGTAGGLSAYGSGEARRVIVGDLRMKSLRNKDISPGTLAHGFLFFPAEAKKARGLRLQLVDEDTDQKYTVRFLF